MAGKSHELDSYSSMALRHPGIALHVFEIGTYLPLMLQSDKKL